MASNIVTVVNSNSPAKIVIVLGMHRSGTSCLTGSLQQAGLDLGNYSEWNPHNLKGNRENTEIMALNEAILVANGGQWDAPPRKIHWHPEHSAAAQRILTKYASSPAWGFKDPRTLLTLEGWLALGIAPNYIGIFRHPAAVVASLMQRDVDTMDLKKAYSLWYAYNKCLLRIYEHKPFPLLCFDWREGEFHNALSKALIYVGLRPGADEGKFYSAELVHQLSVEARLPWKIGRLYKKLRAISEQYR